MSRIQELAKQAHDEFTVYYEKCRSANVPWVWDFEQRFAELLLEESIQVMTKHDYHGEWLGEKLREHFGVE